MNKAELKDRLSEAMEKRGLRSVDLVEMTGIPKVTISYYLSGKTVPRADKLYRLAQALNVSEAWLLGYGVGMLRTEDQRKNDQLAELVVRMRQDEQFFAAVEALGELKGDQLTGVLQMLKAFRQ